MPELAQSATDCRALHIAYSYARLGSARGAAPQRVLGSTMGGKAGDLGGSSFQAQELC